MSHNSILKLVGSKDNIFLSEEQAKKIDDIFADNSISNDFVIRLKNPSITFKKSAVKIIEINSDSTKTNSPMNMDKFYEEERENRKKYLSWSKQKLASYTDIFEGLYKISSGKEAEQSDINKAKEVQEKFFIENPNRTLCDLYLLKPLIPMTQQMISPFCTGFFNLVEKAVFRDMQLSGQFKHNVKLPEIKEKTGNENLQELKQISMENRNEDKKFVKSVESALDNF